MNNPLKRVELMGNLVYNKLVKRYVPLNIQISITKACNFSCMYCEQDKSDHGMSLDKIFSVLLMNCLKWVQRESVLAEENPL